MGSQAPGTTLHYHQVNSHNYANTDRGTTHATNNKLHAMEVRPPVSKATVASAYPSPADEIRHDITPSSPAQPIQHAPSPAMEKTLPSIHDVLRRPMSPSTSPHIAPHPYNASPGSLPLPAPSPRNASGNPYAASLRYTADPELFPDRSTAATRLADHEQPLFPALSTTAARARTPFQATSRRRKRTPVQTPILRALEPSRPTTMSAMISRDPVQWFEDRRGDDEQYWPASSASRQMGGTAMSRTPSSQSFAAAGSMPAHKRKISRQDSGNTTVPSKRARTARGEGHNVTRSSPREATLSFFQTVLEASESAAKPIKPATKRATTPAQPAKKIKTAPEEPDVAYTLYDDTCPDVATLDKGLKFNANWAGKPLNLDNDPNRGLLHAEEIRLASKLALTCARYLYLKRRFYAGRLEFARRSQLYNINAAQQQCKGQDAHGIVGTDVNKTSSMWKAFNSIGWLEPVHMKRYL